MLVSILSVITGNRVILLLTVKNIEVTFTPGIYYFRFVYAFKSFFWTAQQCKIHYQHATSIIVKACTVKKERIARTSPNNNSNTDRPLSHITIIIVTLL